MSPAASDALADLWCLLRNKKADDETKETEDGAENLDD